MTATTATRRTTTKRAPKSKSRFAKTPEQRQADIEALEARQAEAVLALADSDAWTAYLRAGRLFRQYSMLNVLLITVQCPQATRVAGFNTWKALGRNVIKGSKSLKIWGKPYHPGIWVAESEVRPGQDVLERKDGKAKVQAGFTRCPTLSVFDVSQTEGEDLPEVVTTLVDSDADEVVRAQALIDTLSMWLTVEGWTVSTETVRGGANGFTDHDGRRVVLAEGLSVVQQSKTLLHEAAHVVLHGDDTWATMSAYHEGGMHRGVAEVQAESVAWTVASMVGLDTATYSTGYVAGWATQAAKSTEAAAMVEAVKTTAQAVRFGVNALLDVIEGKAPVEAPVEADAEVSA